MIELRFLFWNLNQKDLVEEIKNIVQLHAIDVIILAETKFHQSKLLAALNEQDSLFFSNHPNSLCEKILIFTKFNYRFIKPVEEDNRMTFRRLTLPFLDFNLVAVHLPDKSHNSEDSLSENASELARIIRAIESRFDDKTVLIGDLNMNPFEKGIVKANGLNATMSSKLAEKETRTVDKRAYKFFYNPMWSLMGDVQNEVAGSYYYNNSELLNYQWNVFDQVLIRPSLIPHFDKTSIRFLSSDGAKSLITNYGIPNKNTFSDHLPLIFTLKF